MQQDFHQHYVGTAETGHFIVKRGITFGNRFELVIKINYHFAHRHFILNNDALIGQMVHAHISAAFFFKQGHHTVHKFHGGNNGNVNNGLFDVYNIAMRREIGRIINNFITRIVRSIRQCCQLLRVIFTRSKFHVIDYVG